MAKQRRGLSDRLVLLNGPFADLCGDLLGGDLDVVLGGKDESCVDPPRMFRWSALFQIGAAPAFETVTEDADLFWLSRLVPMRGKFDVDWVSPALG